MRHRPSLKNGAKTVMDIARQFEVGPRQPGGDSEIRVTVVGGEDEAAGIEGLSCYVSIRKKSLRSCTQ